MQPDPLTGERDALRAEVERLREVVELVAHGRQTVSSAEGLVELLFTWTTAARTALAPRDPNTADTRGEEHEHG